jgi:hypothetical protein
MDIKKTNVIGGIIAGFFTGLLGYAVDMALQAVFDAFGTIAPAIILFGAVYGIISFLIGINEASDAGFFFAVGIMLAGWALSDFVTIISGIIALVVLALAVYTGHSTDD